MIAAESIDTDGYMSVAPVVFSPETDIYDAIHVLLQRKVSGATVVNDQREVVGVISEIDCLRAIVNVGYYREGGGTVADFMTTDDLICVDRHMNLVDAAQKIIATHRRRMPVVENGKFVGQISARSLMQAFKDAMTGHDASEDETYR